MGTTAGVVLAPNENDALGVSAALAGAPNENGAGVADAAGVVEAGPKVFGAAAAVSTGLEEPN